MSEPNTPNELEIALVRWGRGQNHQALGLAMEAGRNVEGDEQVTELFARAASLWRESTRGDSPGFADALVAILASQSGPARLQAAFRRIEAAQRILREREGEGFDGAEEEEE